MTRTVLLVLAALASLVVAASALGSASHSTASKSSLKVQPTAVMPAGAVHVYGRAGSCKAGSRLTAFSFAFPESAAGSGALRGKVHKNHTFSIRNWVRGNVLAGTYPVTARCGGSDLGVTASVRVK